MRKYSRLQTWERAILYVSASGVIFSANYLAKNLREVFPEITILDCTRAIDTLLDLGYLEVSSEADPYFRNRPSYVCSSSGYQYYQFVQEKEANLYALIFRMLP